MQQEREDGLSRRLGLFPLASIVVANMIGVGILILAFLERPAVSSIALAAAALGIPACFLFRRRQRVTAGRSERPPT